MNLSQSLNAFIGLLLLSVLPTATSLGEPGVGDAADQQASLEVVNEIIEECGHAATCVLQQFAKYVASARREHALESTLRTKMGEQLEAYSCSDKLATSSDPVDSAFWRNKHVNIMQELPASKIHHIEGFIGADECQAIMGVADKANLGQATVSGGPQYSSFRKALQTNVQIPWNKEEDGHLIPRVARRVYDYTNHVLEGLNIGEHGQSGFKYLHYSGRGRDDTEPDHYDAHCDGNCDGSQHQQGGRVATMVMYCETAEDGGHTHFRNAGVHIAAKPGDALFFTYVNPTTLQMDNGFSVHSGCPVYEGDKKIVTQWVRMGVDEEHPYNSVGFY